MLEVLIALGIVVAISAVVVPWSFGWLGGRELDNAEDRLAMHLMMARAAAREEGKPVEVVAGAGGVEARWLAEGKESDEAFDEAFDGDFNGDFSGDFSGESDEPRGRVDSLFRESPESARGFSASINADWAVFELPAGVEIDVAQAADADRADGAGLEEIDAIASASDSVERPAGTSSGIPQTLAIFLPDGTVIMAPVFLLRTDAGAIRRMRVDGTTGRPKAVDAARAPADGFDRPEFDPEPPADRK